MKTVQTINDNRQVFVAVKTPLMPTPTTAMLPAEMTLKESLTQIQALPPKDANATRVIEQLKRETSGVYHLLALNQSGVLVQVEPSTKLGEIVVPREIRTPRGLEEIPTAAFEVQAYAPVGSGVR